MSDEDTPSRTEIIDFAYKTFDDERKVFDWFMSLHDDLDGQTPLELMETAEGRKRVVEQIRQRIADEADRP